MQGAEPLASPRLSRGRHWLNLRGRNPEGGAGGWLPAFFCHINALLPPTPQPPSRREGGDFNFNFAGGSAPGTPGIGLLATLIVPAKQEPSGRNSWFSAITAGNAFLRAEPAAKERGDRGRWNYPSQATAAFEMVLSPGAGRASAARGKPPLWYHSGRDSQRRHAGAQAKAGTGRERRLPPIIIRSRKVLGGVGDSFKSPPAHPRISVSPYPYPPVRHGDGGRGCRSRRSGRRRGGGRQRRRPRGQRRGGRGTGRSRPCRRG